MASKRGAGGSKKVAAPGRGNTAALLRKQSHAAPPSRRERFVEGEKDDQRSPFQRDRDRILYSSAFRRLAGVTQVVGVAHGHLFHNRLTHTMKVGQVGRRLAEWVLAQAEKPTPRLSLHVDPEVVEAACFAHDLGHPPFGHIAEEELDRCIHKAARDEASDGYEGNAQSFRILTVLATLRADQMGLNLTRAVLDASLKYPWPRAAVGKEHKKFGAYASERKYFDFAREGSPAKTQSIEAQLMDWADDIAYSVHDLEDFYRAGLVPLDRLARDPDERGRFIQFVKNAGICDEQEATEVIMGPLDLLPLPLHCPYEGGHAQRGALRWYTSALVGRYVRATRVGQDGSGLVVEVPKYLRVVNKLLKTLMRYYVFQAPALIAQQHGQRCIVRELFGIYFDASGDERQRGILPLRYRELIEKVAPSDGGVDSSHRAQRARLAADIVAGMTEEQAVAMHGRLTGARPGLVLDKIVV